MPYKDPEKRKAVKRANYLKNSEKIKARMKWNRTLKKLKEWKPPVFTEEQIKAQNKLIKQKEKSC